MNKQVRGKGMLCISKNGRKVLPRKQKHKGRDVA
jgi:hypothetical protein